MVMSLYPDLGWLGGATVLGKLSEPGVLLIWITVGQGPTAIVVHVGGGCLDIFLSSYLCSFSSLSGRWSNID